MGSCMASAIVHLQNQFMPGCIAAHSRDAQVEGSCRLRPSDARHLVGNGNGDELGRLLGQQPHDPGMLLRMLPGISNNGCCTVNEQPSEITISLLGDAAEPLLSPVECCRGTSPIHAAKSRPDLKLLGSVTVEAMAVAAITPIPGTVSMRQLISLARC